MRYSCELLFLLLRNKELIEKYYRLERTHMLRDYSQSSENISLRRNIPGCKNSFIITLTLNLLTIRKKLLLKTFYISFLKPHCSSVWIHFHNHAEVDFIQNEFWRTSSPPNSFSVSDRKWKCNDSLFNFQFYFICQNFLENKTETPKITFFSLEVATN